MLALTFQIGGQRLALDVRAVGEVAAWAPLELPAGSPPWLAGLLVYRGGVVPVIDLHRLLQAPPCPAQLSSRIILTRGRDAEPDAWLGLLASRVSEVREIPASKADVQSRLKEEPAALGPMVVDRGETLRILDLERLIAVTVGRQTAGGRPA